MLTQPFEQDDKRKTMIVYEVNHYPFIRLHGIHRVVWHREFLMTKEKIESLCNENKTHMCLPNPYSTWNGERSKEFKIFWEYGNIPTAHEWDKNVFLAFIAEYRISRLADNDGRIVLLRRARQPWIRSVK